jgi:hypothetical protein
MSVPETTGYLRNAYEFHGAYPLQQVSRVSYRKELRLGEIAHPTADILCCAYLFLAVAVSAAACSTKPWQWASHLLGHEVSCSSLRRHATPANMSMFGMMAGAAHCAACCGCGRHTVAVPVCSLPSCR